MTDAHAPSIDYSTQAKLQGKKYSGGDIAAYAFSSARRRTSPNLPALST